MDNIALVVLFRMRAALATVLLGVGILVGAIGTHAQAATVRDQFLSRALFFETSSCQLLKIEFNFPTRYVSHYPYERGAELRVELASLSGADRPDDTAREGRREALDPPKESGHLLSSIIYDGSAVPRPVLALTFRQPVAFKVAQGGDFRSLIVAVARAEGSGVCNPDFPTTE